MNAFASTIYIFACSPRKGGNCDTMAKYLAKGVEEFGGQSKIIYLRDYNIMPCIGCGYCFSHKENACVLEQEDDVLKLFAFLDSHAPVIMLAPIYFYHLPAYCKSFIDRAQKYWARRVKEDTKSHTKYIKKVQVALVAARLKGEHLFTGSLMSLRLFFDLFQREMEEPILWRGYDAMQDFEHDIKACEMMYSLGKHLAKR